MKLLYKLAIDLGVKYFSNPEEAIKILGDYSLDELDSELLKKLYKQRALELHPDRGGSEIEFKTLQNAYNLLKGWLSDDEDDYPYDEEYEEEEDDPIRDAEWNKFEEEKEKLNDLGLIEFLKYYGNVEKISEPLSWYIFEKIDSSTDEELVNVLNNWKEIVQMNYSRLEGMKAVIKKNIFERMYYKKFNPKVWRGFSREIGAELLEEFYEFKENRLESELEM